LIVRPDPALLHARRRERDHPQSKDFVVESSHTYVVKDWLVHATFGIGQIVGVEEKGISGANVRYYKIRTADSTFWIPIDRMDGQELRPVCSAAEIQIAIAILLGPAETMASNHQIRKNEIQRILVLNTLAGSARLIRDLRARQRERGELHIAEMNTLRSLKQRLLEEWIVATGEQPEHVAARIDELLDH
jgi:CarD family transcriptional regulator